MGPELIIGLLSGAAGGNIVGRLLPNLNLGLLGNSIAGILGGGAGGALLGSLGVDPSAVAGEAAGLDIGAIIGQIAGGGVGGGVLMAVIGMAKKAMGNG